jgi:hypothetical protein
LGDRALFESGLVSLDLGGLELTSLGDFALHECSNLTSVTATSPCSLGVVGDWFLANTPNLSSLDFTNISVTAFGDRAVFRSGIVSLDLAGLQLRSLGDFAFRQCSNLTSVSATSPCTLGAVGRWFLAFTPILSSFNFSNISITTLDDFALFRSAMESPSLTAAICRQ